MTIPYLPIDNAIDVVVENFHAAATPSTPIIDAAMTFTVYPAGSSTAVAGCDGVSMGHKGAGTYRGTAMPTSSLTAGSKYNVKITCSNYDVTWQQPYQALPRAFED